MYNPKTRINPNNPTLVPICVIKNIPTNDRGLFKSQFYVINHTTVPAILVEMGFLSNDAERAMLVTDKRKQQVAKSVVDGIVEYINARK